MRWLGVKFVLSGLVLVALSAAARAAEGPPRRPDPDGPRHFQRGPADDDWVPPHRGPAFDRRDWDGDRDGRPLPPPPRDGARRGPPAGPPRDRDMAGPRGPHRMGPPRDRDGRRGPAPGCCDGKCDKCGKPCAGHGEPAGPPRGPRMDGPRDRAPDVRPIPPRHRDWDGKGPEARGPRDGRARPEGAPPRGPQADGPRRGPGAEGRQLPPLPPREGGERRDRDRGRADDRPGPRGPRGDWDDTGTEDLLIDSDTAV